VDYGRAEQLSPPGEAADFDVVFARLWPGLARLEHLLAGSRVLGEEIAQEVFVAFLARADSRGETKTSSVVRPATRLAPVVARVLVAGWADECGRDW
jgi:DNA-directed RNA polymerase specialized sigma24 family protein